MKIDELSIENSMQNMIATWLWCDAKEECWKRTATATPFELYVTRRIYVFLSKKKCIYKNRKLNSDTHAHTHMHTLNRRKSVNR